MFGGEFKDMLSSFFLDRRHRLFLSLSGDATSGLAILAVVRVSIWSGSDMSLYDVTEVGGDSLGLCCASAALLEYKVAEGAEGAWDALGVESEGEGAGCPPDTTASRLPGKGGAASMGFTASTLGEAADERGSDIVEL